MKMFCKIQTLYFFALDLMNVVCVNSCKSPVFLDGGGGCLQS